MVLTKELDTIVTDKFSCKLRKRADNVWNTFFNPLYEPIDTTLRTVKEEIIKNEDTKS